MRTGLAHTLTILLLLAGAAPPARAAAAADVYTLRDGDRISGRTVFKGKRLFGVQTPYGRLNIPRDKVARIRWADGREEKLGELTAAAAAQQVGLVIVVTGRSFWQAWDPGQAVDPTLRLELRLDESPLASYLDPRPDPDDLPGASVNTFHFAVQDVVVRTEPGVMAEPPQTQPGRITLRLKLPIERAGERRLRLAYQVNVASASAPAWQDAVQAATTVSLKAAATTIVELAQDPGRMEYTRRRMQHVDSFRLTLSAGQGQAELDTPRPQP